MQASDVIATNMNVLLPYADHILDVEEKFVYDNREKRFIPVKDSTELESYDESQGYKKGREVTQLAQKFIQSHVNDIDPDQLQILRDKAGARKQEILKPWGIVTSFFKTFFQPTATDRFMREFDFLKKLEGSLTERMGILRERALMASEDQKPPPRDALPVVTLETSSTELPSLSHLVPTTATPPEEFLSENEPVQTYQTQLPPLQSLNLRGSETSEEELSSGEESPESAGSFSSSSSEAELRGLELRSLDMEELTPTSRQDTESYAYPQHTFSLDILTPFPTLASLVLKKEELLPVETKVETPDIEPIEPQSEVEKPSSEGAKEVQEEVKTTPSKPPPPPPAPTKQGLRSPISSPKPPSRAFAKEPTEMPKVERRFDPETKRAELKTARQEAIEETEEKMVAILEKELAKVPDGALRTTLREFMLQQIHNTIAAAGQKPPDKDKLRFDGKKNYENERNALQQKACTQFEMALAEKIEARIQPQQGPQPMKETARQSRFQSSMQSACKELISILDDMVLSAAIASIEDEAAPIYRYLSQYEEALTPIHEGLKKAETLRQDTKTLDTQNAKLEADLQKFQLNVTKLRKAQASQSQKVDLSLPASKKNPNPTPIYFYSDETFAAINKERKAVGLPLYTSHQRISVQVAEQEALLNKTLKEWSALQKERESLKQKQSELEKSQNNSIPFAEWQTILDSRKDGINNWARALESRMRFAGGFESKPAQVGKPATPVARAAKEEYLQKHSEEAVQDGRMTESTGEQMKFSRENNNKLAEAALPSGISAEEKSAALQSLEALKRQALKGET